MISESIFKECSEGRLLGGRLSKINISFQGNSAFTTDKNISNSEMGSNVGSQLNFCCTLYFLSHVCIDKNTLRVGSCEAFKYDKYTA